MSRGWNSAWRQRFVDQYEPNIGTSCQWRNRTAPHRRPRPTIQEHFYQRPAAGQTILLRIVLGQVTTFELVESCGRFECKSNKLKPNSRKKREKGTSQNARNWSPWDWMAALKTYRLKIAADVDLCQTIAPAGVPLAAFICLLLRYGCCARRVSSRVSQCCFPVSVNYGVWLGASGMSESIQTLLLNGLVIISSNVQWM